MVANVKNQVGVMFDQQHAGALMADRLDQGAQSKNFVGGQAGRGFVQQKKARMQHQRAGDLHEAQLAVLQPVRPHGGQHLQPDDAQRQRRVRMRSAISSRRCRGRSSRASANVAWPPMVPPIMTFCSTDASPTMRGV